MTVVMIADEVAVLIPTMTVIVVVRHTMTVPDRTGVGPDREVLRHHGDVVGHQTDGVARQIAIGTAARRDGVAKALSTNWPKHLLVKYIRN